MNTYKTFQKINEIANIHGIRTIEEVLPTAKEPNHYYHDMDRIPNPKRTISLLEAKIDKLGFKYFFDSSENQQAVIAQQLVLTAAKLIKTIESA